MSEQYALRWLTPAGESKGVVISPQDEPRWTKTRAVAVSRILLAKLENADERDLALRSFTVERIA